MLVHAGKITHEMAIEKSSLEYKKYKEEEKKYIYERSLIELEVDIDRINPS